MQSTYLHQTDGTRATPIVPENINIFPPGSVWETVELLSKDKVIPDGDEIVLCKLARIASFEHTAATNAKLHNASGNFLSSYSPNALFTHFDVTLVD